MQVPGGSWCCLTSRKSTVFLNHRVSQDLFLKDTSKGLTRKTNRPGFMFSHIQHHFPSPSDSIDLDVLWAKTLWQRMAVVIFHSFIPQRSLSPSSELGLMHLRSGGQGFRMQIPDRMISAHTALVHEFLSELWIRRSEMLHHCCKVKSELAYSPWSVKKGIRSLVNSQPPRGALWKLVSYLTT